MPLPNCAPFFPCCHCRTICCRDVTLPFHCIFCQAFYHIITVHVTTPCLCFRKQWWTPLIVPIRVIPVSFLFFFTLTWCIFPEFPFCQSRLCLLPPLSDEYPPSNPQLSSSSWPSPFFELGEVSSRHVPITVLNVFFDPSPILYLIPLAGNVGICVCWLHPSNDRHFCLLPACWQCRPDTSVTFCYVGQSLGCRCRVGENCRQHTLLHVCRNQY